MIEIQMKRFCKISLHMILKDYQISDFLEEVILQSLREKVGLQADEINDYEIEIGKDGLVHFNPLMFNYINISLTRKELDLLSNVMESGSNIDDDLFELYNLIKEKQNEINS